MDGVFSLKRNKVFEIVKTKETSPLTTLQVNPNSTCSENEQEITFSSSLNKIRKIQNWTENVFFNYITVRKIKS